jgi:hypothetical protein
VSGGGGGGPLLQDPFAAILQWIGGLGTMVGAGVLAYRQMRQGAREVAAVQTDSVKAEFQAALSEQRETYAMVAQDAKDVRSQMAVMRERIAVMEKREDERDAVDRKRMHYLQRHAAWDYAASRALRDLDPTLDLGPVPPLYPPAEEE